MNPISRPSGLRLAHFALAAVALCALPLTCVSQQSTATHPVTDIEFQDLSGHKSDITSLSRYKATVFFFSSMECPISNIYTPREMEMAADYRARGVQFFLVDSNSDDSLDAFRGYVKQRGFTFPAVKDDGTKLADTLEAHTTPEAIVVDNEGVVRYRGCIDDNQDRTKIIRHHLTDALNALLAGRKIVRARTPAFGCIIFRNEATTKLAVNTDVTYTRDVAPILNAKCVSCHRVGETAPFPLTSYQNARQWGVSVKQYTEHHLMPPWKAVPGHGDFQDARVMTDQQIATVAKWVDSGMPEGDAKDLPAMPKFDDPTAWSLGKPDVILQPKGPYHLAAEGEDVYRNFVMPYEFKEDTYVSAMEFKPSNRAIVHHIVAFIDPTGESVGKDNQESEPGFSSNGTVVPTFGSQWGEVWVPGRTARFLPQGVAIKIRKGSRLVMQVHYHKNGAIQEDLTKMALYFVKGPVDKVVQVWPIGNMGFLLKPGDSRSEVKGHMTIPVDTHLYDIFPHMHLLGREMRVTATFPDGSKKDLVYINDWDFNWQETYAYKEAVALPKGTELDLDAYYDNSENNPHQPVHPPRFVRFGEETTDEMCFSFLTFTLDDEHLGIQPAKSASR